MAVGGDQIGAHAPGIDLGSLGLQAVDQVLVQMLEAEIMASSKPASASIL